MKNITAVIVSFNREDLLRRAYESIRKFSDMPVIIIDGSFANDPCDDYSRSLNSENTKVVNTAKNNGHGPGMDRGIKMADTDFVLLMDSDAYIKDGDILESMLNLMESDTFGVGQVVQVNPDGTNVGEDYPDPISYLHPHFALINRDIYRKLPGFVHHGAPCLRTMEYINTFKKFIIKDFPVADFIHHDGRGTRSLNPEGFLKGWQ